jgi:hypothetical protein
VGVGIDHTYGLSDRSPNTPVSPAYGYLVDMENWAKLY